MHRSTKVHHRRIEKGLCPNCGKSNDSGMYYCDSCRDVKNENQRELRRCYVKNRVCPQCRKNSLFGDEKMCPECLAYHAEKNMQYYRENGGRKNKDEHNKNVRSLYQYRKENHLCTRCGVKIYSSKSKCQKCLDKDAEKHRMKRMEIEGK